MSTSPRVVTQCPHCQTGFRVRAQHLGREARCPKCTHTFAVVPHDGTPPLGTVTTTDPPEEKKKHPQTVTEDRPAQSPAAARPPHGTANANNIAFRCSMCDTLQHALSPQEGQDVTCPGCGQENRVFALATGADSCDEQEYELATDTTDSFSEQASTLSRDQPDTSRHWDHLDEQRQQERLEKEKQLRAPSRPTMPRYPLLTGYLSFFLDIGLFGRGLGLSLCWIAAFYGTLFFLIFIPLLALPLCWYAAAAAYVIAIVTESSMGNARVYQWPPWNPLDWLDETLYFTIALIAAAAPAWCILTATGSSEIGTILVATVTSVWLLLPVTLLSSLSGDSPFSFLMPEVLFGMGRHRGSCLLYYLLSAIVLALAYGSLLLFLQTVWASPLVIACGALYFRLFGRFAWQISAPEES